ncbi:MAG: phage major capsid protein [Burkholderiaceae bacterium]|nr:phage major capsid protein [Burkholderiaceae bacterium]MBY0467613.1 phage major capsid protein [Burkholderiaceae bacterium]
MKTLCTLALFAVAALSAVAAYAGIADPAFIAHLQTPDAIGLLLLANGPVALPEIKALLDTMQKAFEDFKTINNDRLARIEKGQATGDWEAKLAAVQGDIARALDLKKEIERVEAKANLVGLIGEAKDRNPDKAAYKTAFIDRFVRKGEDTPELKALQAKAWSIGTPADGGYALPEQIDRSIEKMLRDISNMRALANIVTVGTSDYKKLVNVNGIASGWVGETAARPATNTSQLAEVAPPMGEIYANPQVTQQSLDDLFFDVEAELMAQLHEEFAVAEGAAFVSGNGTNKPKGFLSYTTAATADSSRAFGTLEHIATGVSGDFAASNKADIFFQVIAALKKGYRNGAVWMMNKSVLFEALRFKDSTGQYLWQPNVQASGLGIRLLGFDIEEAEDMPAKAANSLSVAFGNFKRGYTIVDRVGIRMLRDPYTNKPYVGFYTTKRVGGAVVNSEAIKLIKFI